MSEKYWPLPGNLCASSAEMELRAALAWELLSRHGIVAGRRGHEDTAGRAVIEEMPPQELVSRAFAIVDCFFDLAIRRGELRVRTPSDQEDAARAVGELERVKNAAMYPRTNKEPAAAK